MNNVIDRARILGKAWLPKPPPGYSYPTDESLEMIGCCAMSLTKSIPGINPRRLIENDGQEKHIRQTGAMHVIDKWLVGNGPTFYPTLDVVDLCDNTDVMGSATGSDIRTVVPAGLICLPSAFSARAGGVTHVLFGIVEKGEEINSEFLNTCIRDYMPRCLFASYFDNQTDGGFITSTLLDERSLDKTAQSVAINSDTGKRENFRMISLLFNLLLVMQSYPQYVERLPGPMGERLHYGGKNAVRPYSARIARPLQQTTASEPIDQEPPSATGRHPRSHWRRGHWRRVPHSPQWEGAFPEVGIVEFPDGRRAHMVWIHPVLVCSEKEAQNGSG